MKIPRDVSEYIGPEVASFWKRRNRRIAIPARTALRIGTLHAILRAVSSHKGVTRDAIVAAL